MPRMSKHPLNYQQPQSFHIVGRCVRSAYLYGNCQYTGNNYDHRRTMFINRLKFLDNVFTIKVKAYIVMAKSYHLVLTTQPDVANRLTDQQVMQRAANISAKDSDLAEQYLTGSLNDQALSEAKETIDQWRLKLNDTSWFMRSLNEYITYAANREENIRGRFWCSAFKQHHIDNPIDNPIEALETMHLVDLTQFDNGVIEVFDNIRLKPMLARIDQYWCNQQFWPHQHRNHLNNCFTGTKTPPRLFC